MRISSFVKQWILGFTVSALMLPGALAVSTVFLFLTSPHEGSSFLQWDSALNRTAPRICLYGTLMALAFCVLLALVACRRFTTAKSACPGPFDQLRQGFDHVKERLGAVSPDANSADAAAVYREASEHIEYLERLFDQPSQVGLRWLLGTGYIDAWRRLHAIEAALLFLEPVPLILRDALHDEMRLQGSSIPQSPAMLKRLRTAVSSLSPTAGRYLIEPPTPESNTPQRPALLKRLRTAVCCLSLTAGCHPTAPPTPENSTDEHEARAALVQVRGAIDEFRDGRREGLVRGRNRLFATVLFAGLTGCVLLYVAILSGAPKSSIVAVAAFYLVGGVVGLVKQMQSASASESASEDDYGLGVVRLIQTPLFSGLAAVGGVVLVKLTQGTGAAGFSLTDTFDLSKNPYGLVAAGLFGLAPALFLSGLQERIEQYKTDLSKSGSSESQDSG